MDDKQIKAKCQEIWEYGQTVFGLPGDISIKVDHNETRNVSRGGARGVSIAMCNIRTIQHTGNFTEYESFKKDPVIGSVTGDAEKGIVALLCHEVAHTVAHRLDPHGVAHGEIFQTVYRALRVKFVGAVSIHEANELVTINGLGVCEVVGFRARQRKYPWIVRAADGAQYRISEDHMRLARSRKATALKELDDLGL